MSITRWTHDNPFIPGTVVRAGAMNAKLDGVAVSIKSIVDRIDKRVPQLPPNFTGNPVIPEQDLNNSLLYISPAGNLTVYRLNTFTNQIEEVVQLRNETESLRDETLQIRNEVEQLKDQSSDFAFNAEQSASDSAGYRDESAYWAQEAQVIAEALGTGVVFYGDWDASSGSFPDEPPVGSGMWKISAVGQSGGLGAFSNVNVGDTLIWFSTESRWILLDTRDQVVSVNGYRGTVEIDVADLASITNFSATLLSQPTGPDWRATLNVLQAGTGENQVRSNSQLDTRYTLVSSKSVGTSTNADTFIDEDSSRLFLSAGSDSSVNYGSGPILVSGSGSTLTQRWLLMGATQPRLFLKHRRGTSSSISTAEFYSTHNKPTAADVGAVPGSPSQINSPGANSRSRYGSVSITGEKGNYVGIHLSPSDVVFMCRNDRGRSGLYDEAASSWLWAYDANGVMTDGIVPWSRVSGRPTYLGQNSDGITITNSGRTTTIGSRNSTWGHYETTASNGHYFYQSITSAGNITAYSDIRVKTNIEKIPGALGKVEQLNGYTFDRTDVTMGRQTGVIAQEVLKVLPEATIKDPETGHYHVAYGSMVGLLIEAIKEQQKQIDELKAEVGV